MRILPAVDLMGGHAVQLVGGDPDAKAVEEPDPVATARRWVASGATGLHVVDLDAALGRGGNEEAVRRILGSVDVPVQVGGGVRTAQRVAALLGDGAHRVVVGTRALTDPAWLAATAAAHPDRLVVALDARDGQVVVRGWTEGVGRDVAQAARALEGLPLAGILCTAVQVEGRMDGIDRSTLTRLLGATRLPVTASGGISSRNDIRFLAEAGVEACVLGMALYTGRLPIQEALAASREVTR